MSGPKGIANTLNRWARDGLNIVGGPDGDALNRLISEYFDNDQTSEECKPYYVLKKIVPSEMLW